MEDFVKEVDKKYDGEIKIEFYPFARTMNHMMRGLADVQLPTIRNPAIPLEKMPFLVLSEKISDVIFVLYSHVDKKLTAQGLKEALQKGGDFPFVIEGPGGLERNFLIPINSSNSVEDSFNRLIHRRIDGILWAQKDGDTVLHNNSHKEIHREHYSTFESVMVTAKNQHGEEINRILSPIIKQVRKKAETGGAISDISSVYQHWQTYE